MTLSRRELVGYDPRWAAIDAAGGLFVADRNADPQMLRDEVLSGRVRALEIHFPDLWVLQDLPLEYLFIVTTGIDVAPIQTMTNLRGLALDSWVGDLKTSALPYLEWFYVVEVERGQFEALVTNRHHRVSWLSVGKYRQANLGILGQLPALTHVSVVNSRSLRSLAGIEGLAQLRTLDVAICPKLDGLDGVEGAPSLRALVLESCNRVNDLGPLAAVPDLRVIQIEMRKPPSLEPLVGHPALEFVWLIGGKRPTSEIEALLKNPQLRMVNSSRASWMRTVDGWLHVDNIYALTPNHSQLHQQLVEVLNRRKYE